MNRTGLLLAFGIAIVIGGAFALFPQWDIAIARPFYEIVRGAGNYFGMRIYPPLMLLRDTMLWLVTIIAVLPGLALLWKLLLPTRRLLIPARAIVFLVMTMALGPGLVTNVILKEHWGRPRPIDIQQFKGNEHFVAWWNPRGDCTDNCSFVSGDASGAFWLLAPAALTPLPWRPLAYAGALVFGATMAGIRIAMGGHFFSDTVFAGIFTFLVIWLAYAAIYRWPRTRLSDQKLETAIERIAMPGYRAMLGVLGRSRPN
jgi:membrane-associated PAP2 superfamily phosphatase